MEQDQVEQVSTQTPKANSRAARPLSLQELIRTLPLKADPKADERIIRSATKQIREAAEKAVSHAAAPARFRESRFGELPWLEKKYRKAVEVCREWANRPWNELPPLLYGPSGTGKSHLLWATYHAVVETAKEEVLNWVEFCEDAALQAVKAGKPWAMDQAVPMPATVVSITNGAEIASGLRASVGTNTVQEAVDRFRQSRDRKAYPRTALFVDDVEVMKMGDWLAEELYRVFDHRYAEILPTPLASNLDPSEFPKQLGDRLGRRMLELVKPVPMK